MVYSLPKDVSLLQKGEIKGCLHCRKGKKTRAARKSEFAKQPSFYLTYDL